MAAAGDSRTVFVRNLSWEATDDDLRSAFAAYGAVDSAKVQVLANGRSKGWGLVTFTSAAAAEAAAQAGTVEHMGRELQIRVDRGPSAPREKSERAPRAPRAGGAGGAAAGAGGDEARPRRERRRRERNVANNDGTKLFVGNIPWSTTEEELQSVFAPFSVVHVEVQKTRSGRSLGRALVTLASADKAARAIAELKDYQVGEPARAMLVKLDELA